MRRIVGRPRRTAAEASRLRPIVFELEDRCLLATGVAATMPETAWPIAEMVSSPSGDVWLRQLLGGGITHITSSGTLTQFLSDLDPATPQDLEADPFGNLWYGVDVGNTAPYLERLTPSGQFLDVSSFGPAAPSVSALAETPGGVSSLPSLHRLGPGGTRGRELRRLARVRQRSHWRKCRRFAHAGWAGGRRAGARWAT